MTFCGLEWIKKINRFSFTVDQRTLDGFKNTYLHDYGQKGYLQIKYFEIQSMGNFRIILR